MVGYCDIRDAASARRSLTHMKISPKHILTANFATSSLLSSISCEGLQAFLGPNNGEIAMSTDGHGDVSQDMLYGLLSSYGDLRMFKRVDTKAGMELICEYYDVRDAQSVSQLNGTTLRGCQLLVEFYNSRMASDFFGMAIAPHLGIGRRLFSGPPGKHNNGKSFFHKDDPDLPAKPATLDDRYPPTSSVQRAEKVEVEIAHHPQSSLSAQTVHQACIDHNRVATSLWATPPPARRVGTYTISTWKDRAEKPDLRFPPTLHESYERLPAIEMSPKSTQPMTELRHTPGTSPDEIPRNTRRSVSYPESPGSQHSPWPSRSDSGMSSTRAGCASICVSSASSSPTPLGVKDSRNRVEFGAIARGRDLRTTVMIKNIPVCTHDNLC